MKIFGEVAEWLKATALHGVVMRATASEVQILPLSANFERSLHRTWELK
jgi:hypothetical protein